MIPLYASDNRTKTLFKMVSQKVPLTNIEICMPAGKALGTRKNLKILLIISELMDDFHTARGAFCITNLSNVPQEEVVQIAWVHHMEIRRLGMFLISKLCLLGRTEKAFRQFYAEDRLFRKIVLFLVLFKHHGHRPVANLLKFNTASSEVL
jgi:hypothetical protein